MLALATCFGQFCVTHSAIAVCVAALCALCSAARCCCFLSPWRSLLWKQELPGCWHATSPSSSPQQGQPEGSETCCFCWTFSAKCWDEMAVINSRQVSYRPQGLRTSAGLAVTEGSSCLTDSASSKVIWGQLLHTGHWSAPLWPRASPPWETWERAEGCLRGGWDCKPDLSGSCACVC